MNKTGNTKASARWVIALVYDLPILLLSDFIFLYINPSEEGRYRLVHIALQFAICALCVISARMVSGSYRQILRYGGSRAYMRLIISDFAAGVVYYIIQYMLPNGPMRISFIRAMCIVAFNLLGCVSARLFYQYIFEYGSRKLWSYPLFRKIIKVFTGLYIESPDNKNIPQTLSPEKARDRKINLERNNVAIVGAGRIGAMLAKELLTNQHSVYVPVCFIETDNTKFGREIYGVPVIAENEATISRLSALNVTDIVFALPRMHAEQKSELYNKYRASGCRILIYDYPLSQTSEFGKRTIREFNIEELLFRDAKEFMSDEVRAFYAGKVVMVTGGGGSIGSELCRQIAKMDPQKLVVLEIYENSAYDLQQELIINYGRGVIPFEIEICSVTDRRKLECVFAKYRPEIVIHAAAHKHVPLMEHNVVEAVENNVFGTKNVVDLAKKYRVANFLMVSTDKAVNPTNVMGATKRMCEMVVMSASKNTDGTKFCATRFGNVLGSNGSVVPLFKKQIAAGGPVTVTDKRIIRYFMTIPEATQLVLTCCALSKNGELFALDMGKPMSILEMAENMIRLSGYEPYKDIDIQEIGLRPGEKLYEELLINFEELSKTENDMIYVERTAPETEEEITKRLQSLSEACDTLDDSTVYNALKKAVPTFCSPESVNAKAIESREFKASKI